MNYFHNDKNELKISQQNKGFRMTGLSIKFIFLVTGT